MVIEGRMIAELNCVFVSNWREGFSDVNDEVTWRPEIRWNGLGVGIIWLPIGMF
jgi:hypothetical protein